MDYKQLIESLSNIEAVAFGYRVNGKVCGMDCSDFEQIIVDAVDAITDLLTHIETDEARAEKAERERDAAIKMLRKIEWCNGCKNFRGLQGCRIGALVTCNPQNDMYVFGEGKE